jgi:hypothetical protein
MRLTNMSSTNISILQLCQTVFSGLKGTLIKQAYFYNEVTKSRLLCDDERIGNEKNIRVEPLLMCVSVCNSSVNVGCFYNWLLKNLFKGQTINYYPTNPQLWRHVISRWDDLLKHVKSISIFLYSRFFFRWCEIRNFFF